MAKGSSKIVELCDVSIDIPSVLSFLKRQERQHVSGTHCASFLSAKFVRKVVSFRGTFSQLQSKMRQESKRGDVRTYVYRNDGEHSIFAFQFVYCVGTFEVLRVLRTLS
jgi:hypothetical protein